MRIIKSPGDNWHVHLAAQAGLGNLEQVAGILAGEGDFVTNLVELCNSDLTGLVVSISYPNGVNSLIDQFRGLLQHGRSQHYDTGCAITDFLILRLRKLDKQFCNVICDFHL